MKRSGLLISFAAILMISVSSCKHEPQTSQDWPQFLGPNRNSTSDQKGILRTWPEAGPEVLWSVEVGIGFGGPVIKDGRVYMLDRNDETGDILRCFNLSDGKELWRYSYSSPGSVQFPGSRSVPAIDGNHIYSCGPFGDLYCINLTTQKPVWNRNIWKDFGGEKIPTWAITQNPLVYGELVIVASQAPEAGVVAYDKLTGDLKWRTPPFGPVSYVSPAIVKVDGEDHVVMITAAEMAWPGGRPDQGSPGRERSTQGERRQQGSSQGEELRPALAGGKVVGINPGSGDILWEYTNWQCVIPIPSAFDAGESRVLVTAGYNAGTAMIKIGKEADGTYSVTELFKNPDFGDHTKPPVLHNGYFYAQNTTNDRRDGLVCMSIDGRIMWKTMRKPLFDKGSMILADGLILATDGRQTLYLIEPDSTAFKPLASADILKEGVPGSSEESVETTWGGATRNWGPMALADGRLLVRDQTRLLCVKVAR